MKNLENRLARLETTTTDAEQRITKIQLVDGVTGEVFAVIEPTSHPMKSADAVKMLEAKHRAKDAGIETAWRVEH